MISILACVAQERCTQGHSYNDDCNSCTCGNAGIYVCTRRTCYNGPQFPDSPTPARKKREDKPACDKGQKYFDGCNNCVCVNDKFYACTERACFPGPTFPDAVPIKDKTIRVDEATRSRREVQESTGKYDPPRPNQLPFLRFDVERCTPYEVKNQVR